MTSDAQPAWDEVRRKLQDLRDLSDFCREWPTFRRALLDRNNLILLDEREEVREIVRWMHLLMDRVCIDEHPLDGEVK